MNLELSLKQTLKLTPQMLQSMEILQMSTLELGQYIQELVQSNPAAELSEPTGQGDESEEMWQRLQAMADADHQNRQYVSADREELDPLARVGTDGGLDDTLVLHLSRQLERSQASTLVLRGAQFLAACLDEDGYLRDGLEELAQASRLPLGILEESLALLQTLDPPGVGAQDLSQCLAIQLRRRGETGPALDIALHHLERLGKRQYHAIAQALGISQEQVLQAQQVIQSLDPRPGAPFARREAPNYIVPDLAVVAGEQGLTAFPPFSSAATTAPCRSRAPTPRCANTSPKRSARPSGPSRRWSSAAPPSSPAPRPLWTASRPSLPPAATWSPCAWPTSPGICPSTSPPSAGPSGKNTCNAPGGSIP